MNEIIQQYATELMIGFAHTLLASFLALLASLTIGVLLAIAQTSHVKLLALPSTIFVEFFRNIPLIVIVMFFYVVLPLYGIPISGFSAGTIGLSLYTSSFISDVVKSGILSVPVGQKEAGLASGFRQHQVMAYIVLPQAVKLVIPPLGNQVINLIKNSSILAIVAGMDLMYQGDLIASETFNVFGTYIVIGALYLMLTVPMSIGMKKIKL